MTNIWNCKNLKPPPIYTLKCHQPAIEMSSICKDLENCLNIDEVFKVEAAVLSRMVYKTNNKLRFDKGFQNTKKVKRCVQRYLDMNTVDIVQYFSSCLPASRAEMYMPSRQMLQYLLVRLMGISRLLHQTVLYCKTAGKFLIKRVCLGQSWNIATLLLGIISRIWSLCQSRVLSICKAYRELILFVPKLIASEAAWLPENFSFPEDLCAWLELELPQVPKTEKLAHAPLLSDRIFNLLIEDDEDNEGVLLKEDPVTMLQARSASSSGAVATNMESEDLGESLTSRDNTVAKDKLKSLKQKIIAINSAGALTSFVSQEVTSNNQAPTQLQFHLKGLLKEIQKNDKLNRNKKNVKLIKNAKNEILQWINNA